jgi:hypothetical protein
MKKLIPFLLLFALILAGCGAEKAPAPLPKAQTDENSQFGVDKNINMETIDQYLFREDVVYRDVRMLFDPADYAAIGGEADLTRTIEGFKIVPYPYLATLSQLPVGGAYNGECLFTVEWTAEGEVASAKANYRESMMILEELFPKDKAIFLMCGGGGYAQMTKELLVFLGWEEALLYNIGANWTYTGAHALELIVYPEYADEQNIYATWRADYAYIVFDKLQALTGEGQ